jgi:O-antigen/teichoic acid export membrane protein
MQADVKRILVRNAAWNYVGFVVSLATNFVLFPFVVGRVGEASSGVWLLLGSLTGYMGLLELGIVPSLTQHVAAALGAGRRDEVNRAASTALAILIAMMGVALQALWGVPLLVQSLHLPPELHADARALATIALVGFAAKMPLAAFQALLLGCQRQDRCNQLWIVLAVAKAVATVVLLLAGFGIVSVVAMEAIAHVLAGGLQITWVRQELPDLSLAWRFVDRAHARAVVALGGTLLTMNLCTLVIEQTDRLVIGVFLPVAEITHYAAAWKLYMLAFSLPTILLQALGPLAAMLHGRRDDSTLRLVFVRMTKYSAGLALPLSVVVAAVSDVLLRLWMGPTFADARPALIALLVAFVATAFNHAAYSTLLGMRRLGPLLWQYYLPQAALNLVLSLLLVRPLGTLGVALGTTIPALALQPIYLRHVFKATGVGPREFWSSTLGPLLAPLAVAFAPLGVAHAVQGASWIGLLPLSVVCGCAYVGCFWMWGLDASERGEILRVARLRAWRGLPQES